MDQKNTNNKVTEFETKGQAKVKSKERMVVTLSSVLILTALTLTGMYINNNLTQKNPITEDSGDLSGDMSGGMMQTPGLEEGEDLQSVDSGTVKNPGITQNSIIAEELKTPASETSNTLKNENVGSITAEQTPEQIAEALLMEQLLAEEAMISEIENAMLGFDGMNMMWPVSEENNVLIPYSMDKAVYFETLDQYKYNPAVIISAEVGTPVCAVSAGRITERYWDYETGWTYEMDLGGGFKVYYGQLDNLQKSEDTYVAAGDVLGYVSAPTKYFMEEGSNLYFAMTKDGRPVYPKDYMGE